MRAGIKVPLSTSGGGGGGGDDGGGDGGGGDGGGGGGAYSGKYIGTSGLPAARRPRVPPIPPQPVTYFQWRYYRFEVRRWLLQMYHPPELLREASE